MTITHRDYAVPGSSIVVRQRIAGLTFKPGLGVFWHDDALNAAIDLKLLFYRKIGVGVWASKEYGGLYLSRRLNDILPKKISPKNLEFTVYLAVRYRDTDERLARIGFRTNW